MIVFIVDYPTEENLRDGMMQRVAAIDTLVEGSQRVYLDISFKRNLRRKTVLVDNCIIEHVNFFLHAACIRKYLNEAKLIYVHSIYNLLKVHFWYDACKTVLDIHGVVPEELALMGKYRHEKIYNIVERKGIEKCYKLIHVTHSMLHHYEIKYDIKLTSRSIILPIFESNNVNVINEKWGSEFIKVAYVGGMQTWQNIDLMIVLINEINQQQHLAIKFSFHLFFPTNQVEIFKNRYSHIIHYDNVSVGTLPKEEIINFLAGCHMGFVLRDSIVVNKVACPTKLIEYLECGLVPIIKSPEIGDFNLFGYDYVGAADLCKDQNLNMLRAKSNNNYEVLSKFHNMANESKIEVQKLFHR